ncbi:MAG: tetratricopeptide repeat protein, partial [bacterium]
MQLMFRGQRLNYQGRYDEAVRVLERAVALDPFRLFGRNQLGLAFAKLNRRAEALAQFRKVLRRDPENFFARAWVGILSQNPVVRLRPAAPKLLSPQARLALTEERRMLSRLSGGEGGLKLQIRRV